MKITSVNVKRFDNREDSVVKGIASVLIDDILAIHDIRIIEGEKGLFVAMPSRKTPSGEYKDVVHPISQEGREMIQTAIFEEYEKAGEAKEEKKEEE